LARVSGYAGRQVDVVGAVLAAFKLTGAQPSDEDYDDHQVFFTKHLHPALSMAAVAYKSKHGHRPTLVMDAADLVAKEDPALFTSLQNDAKRGADKGGLPFNIVFVSSEGTVLPLLMANSARSRMRKPFE